MPRCIETSSSDRRALCCHGHDLVRVVEDAIALDDYSRAGFKVDRYALRGNGTSGTRNRRGGVRRRVPAAAARPAATETAQELQGSHLLRHDFFGVHGNHGKAKFRNRPRSSSGARGDAKQQSKKVGQASTPIYPEFSGKLMIVTTRLRVS
jgi:hypothetical protein